MACIFVTQGLLQKAESLYQCGDFEFSLVFYHRGNKLRPELQEFRLGIQKAQEAIDNSIGGKCEHISKGSWLNVLHCLRYLITIRVLDLYVNFKNVKHNYGAALFR